MRADHMNRVAIRKAGAAGWEPYSWQWIIGGVLVIGGVPRLLKRGPRKGQKTWDRNGAMVAVTTEEIAAEFCRYEIDSGRCGNCMGDGSVVSRAGIDGTTYKQCPRCAGTGKAPD